MYCAIIADIIDSKKTEDRGLVQEKLKRILGDFNGQEDLDIASKFTITLGDEFQGLLFKPSGLMAIINRLKMDMYPVEIRFGIGFGNMRTEINPDMAIGADGPAYYKARESINMIKVIGSKYEQAKQNIYLTVDNPDTGQEAPAGSDDKVRFINSGLAGLYFIESKWSDKEREVIKLMEVEDMIQMDIAEKLGVDQSTISRRIQNSGYLVYKELMGSINGMMNEIWREIENV